MEKWKIIIEWANLPLQKQIVTTLAAFIISNLAIVFFFLNRESTKASEYKITVTELTVKADKIQKEKDDFVKYHLDYVDKKEHEYQNILVELNKINKK